MALAQLHREDVKAAIRKRFGSVAAFERAYKLPEKSVTDVLRGQKSARVEAAVLEVIEGGSQSEGSEHSSDPADAHRLNAEAR